MATANFWRPDWPGTCEPREYSGHAAPYDKIVADWLDLALEWIEENINDARARRTARSIVVHVPIYTNDNDSMPKNGKDNGEPIVDFSIRQMAKSCGKSDMTIHRVIQRLTVEGGPLKRVWTPPKGDRSMGAAYALKTPLSIHNSALSTTFSEGDMNTENAPSVFETPRDMNTENAPSVFIENDTPMNTPISVPARARSSHDNGKADRGPRGVPTPNAARPALVGTELDRASKSSLSNNESNNENESDNDSHRADAAHEGRAPALDIPTYEEWVPIAKRLNADPNGWESLTDSEQSIYKRGYRTHNLRLLDANRQLAGAAGTTLDRVMHDVMK